MIISGSPRAGSASRVVANQMALILRKLGAEADILHLSETPLPFFDGRSDMSTYPPEVAAFQERATRADAFFIVSPEYHGSPSGALKNALELLDVPHFQGKVVALAAMAGGPRGGMTTLVALRHTFRALLSWVMPEQVAVCEDDFDQQKRLKNPAITQRLIAIARGLLLYGDALRSAREKQLALR